MLTSLFYLLESYLHSSFIDHLHRSGVAYILKNARGPQIESYNVDEGEEGPPYNYLNWSCADMARKVWAYDDVWRENVTNAILSASAFIDLCIKNNPKAQAAVMKKAQGTRKKVLATPAT